MSMSRLEKQLLRKVSKASRDFQEYESPKKRAPNRPSIHPISVSVQPWGVGVTCTY